MLALVRECQVQPNLAYRAPLQRLMDSAFFPMPLARTFGDPMHACMHASITVLTNLPPSLLQGQAAR